MRLRAMMADGPDSSTKLEALFEGYAQFTREEPDLAEVLTVELRESGKFMNEFAAPLFGEFLRLINEVLEEGQRSGEFRSDVSSRNIARAIFGVLDELSLAWVMSKRKWDLNRSGREVLDVFLAGLRAVPGDANEAVE